MLSSEQGEENKDSTIWDRSTLYGMKCAFLSGYGDRMMQPLLAYCHKRLVCDCVPYAVEAYPEGGKRHLSGESALFVRVITEGMFGIVPEGLDSFSFVPMLYEGFSHLYLYSVSICGECYDIKIDPDKWQVFCDDNLIASGVTDHQRVYIRKNTI